MPGLPNELRIIFAWEFRRQIRNKGFMFFTGLIIVLMVGAIPVTPLIANLFEDAQEESAATAIPEPAAVGRGGTESTFGYVDPADILPGAAKSESLLRLFGSKDEGIQAVRNGEIDTLFVLPADYVESGRIEDYWTTRDRGPLWDNNGDAERYFRSFLKDALTHGASSPLRWTEHSIRVISNSMTWTMRRARLRSRAPTWRRDWWNCWPWFSLPLCLWWRS